MNINLKPRNVAAKEIDLDTSNILIRAENGDYLTADIMAAELKQWMKESNFAKELNEYADMAPTYGTVVVKRVRDRFLLVELKNLVITDPTARSLDHTNVIETHLMTEEEILRQDWDKEKVQEAINLYHQMDKPLITVDERYGWVRESELNGGSSSKLVYTLAIVAGAEEVERAPNTDRVIEHGIVLHHEAIKKHPYREWHWARVPGRWLGLGYVELTMDAQIRVNEVAYYRGKALMWTSKHLFQTDDETVQKNLFTDVRDGDIIVTSPGKTVSAVPMEERNLAHYRMEDEVWQRAVLELTMTPDIITGEGLPSGTPARSAIISDTNAKKFFDRKREDFGIFVRGLIEEMIPEFVKQKGKSHVFSFAGSGEDRDKIERLYLDARMVSLFQDYVTRVGAVPSLDEWLRIEYNERIKLSQRKSIEILIPEDTFKNLKYRLDIVITKENEDTDAKIAGRQAVLAALAANPQLVTSPATRPIFAELLHLLGIKNVPMPSMNAPMMQQQPMQMQTPNETGDVLNSVPIG